MLDAFAGPSYNFHPGPPNRPGRYPSVFALYDNARHFGITVHEMLPKVDSGAIKVARLDSGRYGPPTLNGTRRSGCFRYAINFGRQE